MLTKEIRNALSETIPPREIGWKPQVIREDSALMVAYVDARWVAERLDEAADGDWTFTWESLGVQGNNLVIKATLTVCGVVREDVGEHEISDRDMIDPHKSAVSDALKRAAVLFGVGRELYRMDSQWVRWDKQRKRPMPGEMDKLIAKLHGDLPDRKSEASPEDTLWVTDSAIVTDFFGWAGREKGLTQQEALEALGVKEIEQYRGTKKDAVLAINSYLNSR